MSKSVHDGEDEAVESQGFVLGTVLFNLLLSDLLLGCELEMATCCHKLSKYFKELQKDYSTLDEHEMNKLMHGLKLLDFEVFQSELGEWATEC